MAATTVVALVYTSTSFGQTVTAPPGSYYNTNQRAVMLCPPGSYQPNANQTSCIKADIGGFAFGPGQTINALQMNYKYGNNPAGQPAGPIGTPNLGYGATSQAKCPVNGISTTVGSAVCVNAGGYSGGVYPTEQIGGWADCATPADRNQPSGWNLAGFTDPTPFNNIGQQVTYYGTANTNSNRSCQVPARLTCQTGSTSASTCR